MIRSKTSSLLAATVLVMAVAGCNANAKIVLTNTTGSERGVLASGRGSSGPFTYQRFTSITDTVDLGQQLSPSGGNDEVLAFENVRPPAIRTPVTWTGGSDTVNLALANEIFIPITVWILKTPFATQQARAINTCITTTQIWDGERMGLGIGSFDITDATGNAKAATYQAFDCTKQAGIQTDIGKLAGRINIYIVDTVDGGTGRGNACNIGSDFVALGSALGFELAAHETGHDFALTHVDDLTATFDQTNIMHSVRQHAAVHHRGTTLSRSPDVQLGDQRSVCRAARPTHKELRARHVERHMSAHSEKDLG